MNQIIIIYWHCPLQFSSHITIIISFDSHNSVVMLCREGKHHPPVVKKETGPRAGKVGRNRGKPKNGDFFPCHYPNFLCPNVSLFDSTLKPFCLSLLLLAMTPTLSSLHAPGIKDIIACILFSLICRFIFL